MTFIGELSLWISLLMAVWAAVVSFAGGALARDDVRVSGERAIHASFAMALVAVAGLLVAIYTRDFSIRYVASVTSSNLPVLYRITAMWAGPQGALLFFTLLLAGLSNIALSVNSSLSPRSRANAAALVGAAMTLCLVILLAGANPFARFDWIPIEGQGMSPHLQDPVTAFYRPSLFAGLAAAIVTSAIGAAGFLSRPRQTDWFAELRWWIPISWCLTSMGILAGIWWRYLDTGAGVIWTGTLLEIVSLVAWGVITVSAWMIVARKSRDTQVGSHMARAGLFVIVLGAVMVAAAFAGRALANRQTLTLASGDSREAADPFGRRWTFVSQGLSRYAGPNRQVIAVVVGVSSDGEPAGVIASEKRQYVDGRGAPAFGPSIEAGIRSSWMQDVHVALIRVDENENVEIRVSFTPLARWLWIGGLLIVLGGMLALWPEARSAHA